MEDNERDFLKMLGATGTKKILEFLDEHRTAQYKEMAGFVNTHSLNQRLRDLLDFELVSHHLERNPKRREWYSLTEKGKYALQHSRALTNLIKRSS